MAFSKPFTEEEIDYIRMKHGVLSTSEIAEKLERSQRGVRNKIKELGLNDAQKASCARVYGESDGTEPEDRLDALYELKSMIRAEVIVAEGQAKAKLSQEYREILAEIDELENPTGEESGEDELGRVLCSIDVRTP